ncbi:MAG: hypothetical protein KF749_08585 [Bacteroidetes bacterium]|nr:hypothetical protein [Bacteroidota bacterium]MCW5895938.1 hypothetical protein [Bacteroidota bacterium]
MKRLLIPIMSILVMFTQALYSQCSDAGVCSIGSQHEQLRHSFSAGYVFGKSSKSDDLTFHSFQVEGSIRVLEDSRLSIVLPWSSASGPLGKASGIGDLTILWSQVVLKNDAHQLSVQIGGKFATGNADLGNLPQAYQPGLGTNDLLLGISFDTEPWLFALGYQLSRGRSDNAATQLKRGDDVLARVGYKTGADDFTFGLELLAIKRLQEASILSPSAQIISSFMSIPESDRLQVNVLGTASMKLSESYSLRVLGAVPLRSRPVNVDGLTRSITLSLGLQYAI